MSRTQTFSRVQSDARRIAQAHRAHTHTAYFGCPLCVIATRRDTLPRWSSPRRA
jgi:hypothetical protein